MKCEICGEREAVYTCRLCGRRVCGDDYDSVKGVCKVCSEAMCEICGRQLAIGYCKYCGRIGCEDCLIQVSTVEYVCKDCAFKYRLKH
ncbi:hypothetical protein Desmu_0178 [Desulfurococcus mucosus DSM 2162]|uniref:B box-type domain-containing protein n=1 Tax=Desulfurococcus mucosus (strain ATCC 35584 / DSM 2162 / JCM 9187 / O7/1) TaxID=765177 RepID=E8R7K2_DESM0|nr:hypothetical protein Desmu_0178 [Desulfurococcus mucosus DSM 2162]